MFTRSSKDMNGSYQQRGFVAINLTALATSPVRRKGRRNTKAASRWRRSPPVGLMILFTVLSSLLVGGASISPRAMEASSSAAPSQTPTGAQATVSPSPYVSPVASRNFPMLVVIHLDSSSYDVSWSVVSKDTGTIYANHPPGTYDFPQVGSVVETAVYLDAGKEYVFTITGISRYASVHEDAYYEVYMGTTDSSDESARVVSMRGGSGSEQNEHTLLAVHPETSVPRFAVPTQAPARGPAGRASSSGSGDGAGEGYFTIIFIAVGPFLFIVLCTVAQRDCRRGRGRRSSSGSARNGRIGATPRVGSAEDGEGRTENTEEVERLRREFVIGAILTNQVPPNKKDDTSTEIASPDRTAAQPLSPKDNTDTGQLIAEPTGEVVSNLGRTSCDGAPQEQHRRNSHKVCSICLESYKPGEEVCSSPNRNCPHVFHRECMIGWLMTHDECPMCREDYLRVVGEVEEKGKNGTEAAREDEKNDQDVTPESNVAFASSSPNDNDDGAMVVDFGDIHDVEEGIRTPESPSSAG